MGIAGVQYKVWSSPVLSSPEKSQGFDSFTVTTPPSIMGPSHVSGFIFCVATHWVWKLKYMRFMMWFCLSKNVNQIPSKQHFYKKNPTSWVTAIYYILSVAFNVVRFSRKLTCAFTAKISQFSYRIWCTLFNAKLCNACSVHTLGLFYKKHWTW